MKGLRSFLIIVVLLSVLVSLGISAERITFWYMGSETPDVQKMKATLISRFKAATGIDVKWETISWDGAWNKLTAAIASGDVPDVSMVGYTWASTFYYSNATIDLAPYVGKYFPDKDAWVPGGWSSMGKDGHIFSVVWDADTTGFLIRKDIFEKAKVEPPKTWVDMIVAAKLIQERVGVKYPILIPLHGWDGVHNFQIAAWQNGTDWFTPDGKKAIINNPKNVQAVEFLYDLITKYHVADIADTEYSGDEAMANIYNGQAAMTYVGGNDVYNLLGQYPDLRDKIAFVKPPAGFFGDSTAFLSPDNLVVFKGSKHKIAALKWIKFLSEKPQQVLYCSTVGLPSPLKAAWDDPAFSTPFWKGLRLNMEVGKSSMLIPAFGYAENTLKVSIAKIGDAVSNGTYNKEVLYKILTEANDKVQRELEKQH